MPQYHRVIDDLTAEELEKVKAVKADHETSSLSDIYIPSERLLAEFGSYFGWEALLAAKRGEIAAATFAGLIAGARSVRIQERLEQMEDTRMAVAAAIGDKKTQEVYKTYLEHQKKLM